MDTGLILKLTVWVKQSILGKVQVFSTVGKFAQRSGHLFRCVVLIIDSGSNLICILTQFMHEPIHRSQPKLSRRGEVRQ